MVTNVLIITAMLTVVRASSSARNFHFFTFHPQGRHKNNLAELMEKVDGKRMIPSKNKNRTNSATRQNLQLIIYQPFEV